MGAASSSFQPAPNSDPLELQPMMGSWYVVESNLDVWKSRICPVISYELIEPTEKEKKAAAVSGKPLPVRVKDSVEYRTGTLENQSKCGYFLGVDTQDPSNPSVWRWRGSGLLCAFTSDWQLVRHDPDYRWAITVFGPTTFTQAGADIYYREPVMPDELRAEIQSIIDSDPYLKQATTGLFKTVQDPRGRNRGAAQSQPQATAGAGAVE